jgi:hypothetical protein
MSSQVSPQIHPTRAAAVRARLTDRIPAVRTLLRAMVQLPIKGSPNERAIAGLSELKTLYGHHETELRAREYEVASGWAAFVDGAADRERAMRALEMSTLFELRRGLRRGGCWVDYSDRYRDREQVLIPEEQWKAQRRRHLSLLRLPEKPKEYLASLVTVAKQGLDAVSNALARGELSIQEGDISLPKLEKEDVPPPVRQARDAIATHIGTIQLPELLLEMDMQTRFAGDEGLGRRQVCLVGHDELADIDASVECATGSASQNGIHGDVHARFESVAHYLSSAHCIRQSASGRRHRGRCATRADRPRLARRGYAWLHGRSHVLCSNANF